MKLSPVSQGVYKIQNGTSALVTYNSVKGKNVYGEKLIEFHGDEYREWNPKRSKVAAMLMKKIKIPLVKSSKVLYLGASTGTTVSHISDIVTEGIVYSVEFSPRPMRELIKLCEMRSNIIPLLADASNPSSYSAIVENVDIIIQDIAQPNQAEIALLNSDKYLKPGGYLVLSIKARSIDTVENPKKIYKSEMNKLLNSSSCCFELVKKSELAPYHKDHLAIVAKAES
ncbi:fibrillarin-like rRNA/tRNA 2'-O-methyltransferase [Methanosalsum natronophilum]|uniref:Fibrillarin-like rRNA/tRNA 2'-O-methyltransferase n=1 Tax=Methanosalsum natronophilum TaxID=768733 RepID=A0A424YMJ7_9EURY|nr:MAG: fibrillarin-like rRNA/tRNA 2'-O-methyltransferase [Methanosalsum natronophilum]